MNNQTQRIQLTPREMDVLRLLCSGVKPRSEMPSALSISEHTVHFYIERLKIKLGVNSQVQLVAYALLNGLVSSADIERQGGTDQVA